MTASCCTFRLRLSYLGTRFAGWQIQPSADTIQGRLEAALEEILCETVRATGAGRTDAGVHAEGQVAHFVTTRPRPAAILRTALNALLPKEIRVESAARAGAGFDARRDATGKRYRYLLHMGGKPSPFRFDRVGRIAGPPPEIDPMRDAARRLLGRHDFSAFCGAGTAIEDRRRTLTALDISRRGDTIRFCVEGNGFLRHQVRNLVGTLVEVGRRHRRPASMQSLLASRDRRQAGATAPACGLCLLRVHYARRPGARSL